MASYDASINVRVSGTSMVDGVINRVQELERLVRNVNTRPLDLSRAFGRGDIADRFGAAARELNSLKNSFINSERAVEAFGTTAGRTIANTTALASSFRQIAANSDVATAQFREFTVAAQQAAVAANSLGRARLSILAEELSGGTGPGGPRSPRTPDPFGASRTIGGPGLVNELIAQRAAIPNSISALNAYQGELRELQQLVTINGDAYWRLERAIRSVDRALNQTRIPAFPPAPVAPGAPAGGTRPGVRGGPPPGSLAFNPNPSQENLALGAGFPLLFGGGVGQVAGGLIGSMFGGGFGGQILGAAIGQQLTDAFVRITEIGKALDTLNMDTLRDSAITVNSALDYQVSVLLKAGKAEEARAVAAREVFAQTGVTAGALDRITGTANQLKGAWDGVVGAVSGTAAILGQMLLPGFIITLRLIEGFFRGINAILTVFQDIVAGAAKWVLELAFGKEIAEKIYRFFKGTNEEEEKLTAELARSVDEQKRNLKLSEKLLAIDKTRTSDTSTRGKLINIEADRQEKLARIVFDFDEKREAIQKKYGALKTAEGKKLLADSLALNDAEKAIAVSSAELTAERAKQLALSKKVLEQDQSSVGALKAQQRAIATQLEVWGGVGSIVSARIGAEQQLNSLQKVRLERDYENAKTAQKRYDIAIALFRTEVVAAQLEYQNTLASITLDTEKLKLQQSMAVLKGYEILAEGRLQLLKSDSAEEENKKRQQIEDAVAAQNQVISGLGIQIGAQQAIGRYQAEGAAAAYKAKIETAGMALQQKLASDAIGLGATKAQNIATNMINAYTNTSAMQGVTDNLAVKMNDAAIAASQGAQNVTQISTATLGAATSTDTWRQAILDKEAATNKAFQEEYKAIQDNLKQKEAAYAAAVAAAKKGDREIAESNGFSVKTLQSNWAMLLGYIKGLYSNFLRGLLGGVNNAIGAINSVIRKYNSLPTPPFPDVPQLGYLQIPAFAEGGLVTGPTLAMVGEGGESEYIIPESKMATASANYLAGGRGAGIMEGGGGGSAPSINITTGPVVEFNGERYVTMRDMERGLQQMATNIYSGLRTPSGRYATGVR